jgi:Raf kinase inhibitor-like YbhB/YbcL family protein
MDVSLTPPVWILSAFLALACGTDAKDSPGPGSGGSGGAPGGSGGSGGNNAVAGGTSAGSGGIASGGGGAAGASAGTGGSGGSSGASAGSGGAGGSGGSGGGTGGGGGGNAGAGGGGGAAPFVLSSPVIDRHDDCTRDAKNTCDTFDTVNILGTIGGQNQSPELSWTAGPAGTMSYAIGLHDLSNGANGYTHWVVWNIPAGTLKLPANLQHKAVLDEPAGAKQSSFQQDNAYAGPGAHGNVYEFKVYALKVATINVQDADDQAAIRKQLESSQDVLATSILRAKSP